MSGYTPLFDTLTKGTLCGKWPDIGLWPIVLSLSDRHGVVDMHPNAIAALTGLPADEVVACMKRFCEPDPASRSREADGARLVPLDPDRDWGWKVVNHARYAEKVRLMHKNAREVESGKNRERVRRRPPATAGDRRKPPETASAISSCKKQSQEKKGKARKRATPPPKDFTVTEDMRAWAAEKCPAVKIDRETEAFLTYHRAKGTTFKDWGQAWRNWMLKADGFQERDARRDERNDFDAQARRLRERAYGTG